MSLSHANHSSLSKGPTLSLLGLPATFSYTTDMKLKMLGVTAKESPTRLKKKKKLSNDLIRELSNVNKLYYFPREPFFS